jgi:hypothetical protein|tara:strand:+ start:1085 stop:1615 length:531 start_codon:yes stop_codon:yes gene_type:complete
MKQKKLSKTLGRTTVLKTLRNNLKKCAEQEYSSLKNVRRLFSLTSKSVATTIPIGSTIPINYFYEFLNVIPKKYWCVSPVFYHHPERFCWDALGFLGESIHRSTVRTKYLELCFKKLDISISEVLDNEEELFMNEIDNKKRFLISLKYLEEKLDEKELKLLLIKAKKLSDEEFKFE